jgi:hypothetical protein
MDDDLISSIKRDKQSWFGNDRKTNFKSAEPNHRYFMGKIKEEVESFLTENKTYLLEHNPALLYTMRGQPVPKKYLDKVAAGNTVATSETISEKKEKVIEEVVQVRSELDQYQEDLKRKRQEQLDKRTQTSVEKQSLFLVRPKKDPHRGMCWVDPYPSINQGRLGHSQVWTEKKPKRYYD